MLQRSCLMSQHFVANDLAGLEHNVNNEDFMEEVARNECLHRVVDSEGKFWNIRTPYGRYLNSPINNRLLSYGNQVQYPKYQYLLDSQSISELCDPKYAEHFEGSNEYPIRPWALVNNTDTSTLSSPFKKIGMNPMQNFQFFYFLFLLNRVL